MQAAPAAEVPKAEAEVGEPIEAKATDAGNSAEAKDVKEVKFLLPAKARVGPAHKRPQALHSRGFTEQWLHLFLFHATDLMLQGM